MRDGLGKQKLPEAVSNRGITHLRISASPHLLVSSVPPLVAKPVQLAAVALRRTALFLIHEGGWGHAQLFGETRARGDAVRRLLVERHRDARRSAPLGQTT